MEIRPLIDTALAPKGQRGTKRARPTKALLNTPLLGMPFAPSGTLPMPSGQQLLEKGTLRTSPILASATFSQTESAQAKLYFHLHSGAEYVQTEGPEQTRVMEASLKSARELARDGTPTRFISFSSASGWLEVYPQDGTPVAYSEAGKLVPFEDIIKPGAKDADGSLLEPTPRASRNSSALLRQLYGDTRPDLSDGLQVLSAIQRANPSQTDRPGRIIFHVEGLGPAFQRDTDGPTAGGVLAQQLHDMKTQLRGPLGSKQVVFSDGPGMGSAKLPRYLTVPFKLDLPDQKAIDGQAFTNMITFLCDAVPPAEGGTVPPASSSDDSKQLAAWREVVGPNILERHLRRTIELGVSLDQFKQLLPEGATFADFSRELLGLTLDQVRRVLSESTSRASVADKLQIDRGFVRAEKANYLKAIGVELVQPPSDLAAPAGVDAVLDHVKALGEVLKKGRSRTKPVPVDKFLLFSGVPGAGKSLVCQTAAKFLDLPLYKVELASIFSKWVGDTEANAKALLETLEALAPCAVHFDEIEKALGGTAEGSTQVHETTSRVVGLFLSWLQDHRKDIVALGTVNDPTLLASALLSRVESKYFFGYHEPEALAEVWLSNLTAKCDSGSVKLSREEARKLAALKPSIIGREVEHAVKKIRRNVLLERGPDTPEQITFEDVAKVLRGLQTEFERNPERAAKIMALSSQYESASGRPIFTPQAAEARLVDTASNAVPSSPLGAPSVFDLGDDR